MASLKMKSKKTKKDKTKEILTQIKESRVFRTSLANKNMFLFFGIYFAHYIEYQSASFQKEIFSLVSGEKQIVAITAFRNSAKSTICSLVLPIWGIVGKWKKKYVVIVCQNQSRAKDTLANIRMELERIGILSQDYQPREGKTDRWNEDTIIIPKYQAKITAISTGEAIRGMRHLQYRPDLVISDDLEDVPSCQNYESRKKLWQFVNGELIPAGDQNTKYIFIGNKVHNDSLMMKLKAAIELGKMKGIYREYPLIDEKGEIAWPGKFPNMKAIEKLKGTYASEIDYLREQMLMILPDGDAIIKPEDIHYYKELPIKKPDYYLISIDPAFSEKSTADNTAVLVLAVYKENKTIRTYVLNPVLNKKLETDQLIKEVKKIIGTFNKQAVFRVFVEDVSAQTAIVQMLQYANIPAEGVGIGGKDKKTRLSAIAPFVKNGQILFPIKGVEELINQLLYFGTERYDDLVDALTLAINKIIREENDPSGQVLMIRMKQSPYDAAIKSQPIITNNIYPHSLDWADKDDQEIFRKYKMRNPQRICELP